MRITDISAVNYLRHRGFNLEIAEATRVVLICGPNGSGKTGIAQGIKLALTGEPVRDLQYKKDLSKLITQGESTGEIVIGGVSNGSPGEWRFNLKAGVGSGGEVDGALWSLDPAAFLKLDAKGRRQELFKMAGIVLKPEAIKAQLVKMGHDGERVDKIVHHLRLGFDKAADAAKEQATEARGAWKLITGETHGAEKGKDWKAKIPPREIKTPLEELRADLAKAKNALTEKQQANAALKAAGASWKNSEKATQAQADLKENEVKLDNEKLTFNSLQTELEELERSSHHQGGMTEPCPACGVVLMRAADGKLKEYEKIKPTVAPLEAHKKLKVQKDALAQVKQNIADLEQKVADGRAAKALLANLPPKPKDEDVRKATTAESAASAAVSLAENDLRAAEREVAAVKDAEEKTVIARKYHDDIAGYVALADAVQNLPAQYLADTLTRVNNLCGEIARGFDKPVVVGEDMEPLYGTIPYALASESEQWRVHAALGYALAQMGGLRVLVLDQFDHVEPAKRGAILKALSGADEVEFIVCATLKAKPEMAAPFQVAWLG